jgi:transcription elongation GreA/GreB family factor
MSLSKQEVYALFMQLLLDKCQQLQTALDELRAIGASETKSTAGDKHETALAMVQLEQEKKRQQLNDGLQQLAALKKIDPAKHSNQVALGSVVVTNSYCFFIAVALGKIVAEADTIQSVSPQSPLGKALLGHRVGDSITVNNQVYTIVSIA